jgi:hypothetical protein
MRWFWGVVLIFIGVIFLGANFGWWSAHDFVWVWQFWPILLIFLGISILLRHWRFGGTLLFLLFVLFLVFAVYSVATKKTYFKNSNCFIVCTKNTSYHFQRSFNFGDMQNNTGASNEE